MTTTDTTLAQDIGLARETDYYLMTEQLTKDELELLYRVRKFAETEILPVVNPYWERGEFPFELVPKIAAQNIVGDTMTGYGTDLPAWHRRAKAALAAVDGHDGEDRDGNEWVINGRKRWPGNAVWCEVTAMQLYCIRLGRLLDDGKMSDTRASLAKYFCSVKARHVCRLARDILDQTLIVGRDITGQSAFA